MCRQNQKANNGVSMVYVGEEHKECCKNKTTKQPNLLNKTDSLQTLAWPPQVAVEMPPTCSSAVRPGRPVEEALSATQRVQEILKSSKALNLKQLCMSKVRVTIIKKQTVYASIHGSKVRTSTVNLSRTGTGSEAVRCQVKCHSYWNETIYDSSYIWSQGRFAF